MCTPKSTYIFYANGTCNVLQLTMVTMNFLSSICAYTMSLSYHTHKHIDRFPFSFGIQNIAHVNILFAWTICDLICWRFLLLLHSIVSPILYWAGTMKKKKKKTQSTIFDKNHTHSLHFLRYLMELKERVCANVWWNISKQDLSCIMIKRILC